MWPGSNCLPWCFRVSCSSSTKITTYIIYPVVISAMRREALPQVRLTTKVTMTKARILLVTTSLPPQRSRMYTSGATRMIPTVSFPEKHITRLPGWPQRCVAGVEIFANLKCCWTCHLTPAVRVMMFWSQLRSITSCVCCGGPRQISPIPHDRVSL